MTTLIIGLTGNIASGKSTVANMFEQFSIPVVDADKIARDVVVPGKEAYLQIINEFGYGILKEDKTLNRKKLGSIIFSDEVKRQKLNEITHPEIRKEMNRQKNMHIETGSECVVLDIPLLFESKLTNLVDKIIVVYVDENTQLQRLIKRDNLTKEQAKERIKSQIPIVEKVGLANGVVDNNGSIKESYNQLKDILTDWNVLR